MIRRVVLLTLSMALGGVAFAQERVGSLADVLTPKQVAYLAEKRPGLTPPEGSAYRFVFKDVPGYEEVAVYYLMETAVVQNQRVRRLAESPAAVHYVVVTSDMAAVRRHLSEENFAKVVRELMAAKRKSGPAAVRITRTLFDIGGNAPGKFFENREKYYNFETGLPLFDAWPAAYRTPGGKFTVSIEHAEITEGPGKPVRIEGRQAFGYQFPVLDDLLTDAQKRELAEAVASVNVREGSFSVTVKDVRDFGDVTLYYVARDGKPLAHPTAMTSRVHISAKAYQEEPLALTKYLPPEGVAFLTKHVRESVRAGKKLRAIEIVRMHFDIVTKDEPRAKETHDAFKRDVARYSEDGVPVHPETWPDSLRRPDGLFDVERDQTRVLWLAAQD